MQGGDQMKTRAQKDLDLAAKLVEQVASQDNGVKQIYGGLCHSFPVLVRTSGLCQAIAFSEDKKAPTGNPQSERNEAHRLLLNHVAQIVGLSDERELLEQVRDGDAQRYMFYTRRILSAWVYFKRFAVSILKVKSAQEAQDDNRS